jgi:hypothetical protein
MEQAQADAKIWGEYRVNPIGVEYDFDYYYYVSCAGGSSSPIEPSADPQAVQQAADHPVYDPATLELICQGGGQVHKVVSYSKYEIGKSSCKQLGE